ncbi:hypothetical protein ABN028_32465 [Actinopolymorpha sp. B17G11]|uniref:hypothetical protein n=1 Tax=Actinopolymorpha sp. B17G11 TaxID=3160861 RepID=UPI0032E3B29A
MLTQYAGIAANVIGRRLFDLTKGWNGKPAAGQHMFVVTHEPPTDWWYAGTAPFSGRVSPERPRVGLNLAGPGSGQGWVGSGFQGGAMAGSRPPHKRLHGFFRKGISVCHRRTFAGVTSHRNPCPSLTNKISKFTHLR